MVVSAVINEISRMSTEALTRTNAWEHSTDLSLDSSEMEDFSQSSRAITPTELEHCIDKMKSKMTKARKIRRRSALSTPINEMNHDNTLGSSWAARRGSLIYHTPGQTTSQSTSPKNGLKKNKPLFDKEEKQYKCDTSINCNKNVQNKGKIRF